MSLASVLSAVRSNPTPKVLADAKAQLALHNLLCPTQDADAKDLAIARDILEAGAFAAIRAADLKGFDRYIGLLRVFWEDYG